jgi:hypothetical protein
LQVCPPPRLRTDQRYMRVADPIRRMCQEPRPESSLFRFQLCDTLPNRVKSIARMQISIRKLAHDNDPTLNPPRYGYMRRIASKG